MIHLKLEAITVLVKFWTVSKLIDMHASRSALHLHLSDEAFVVGTPVTQTTL